MYDLDESIEKIAARFAVQFKDAEQTQGYLNRKELLSLGLDNKVTRYESSHVQEQETYVEKAEKLAYVQKRVPYLEGFVSSVDDPEVQDEFNTMLKKEKYTQLDLEQWMDRNNPTESNDEFMNNELNKVARDFNIAVGQRLAEWFATGAAGPGTVTFMGKEYTAS